MATPHSFPDMRLFPIRYGWLKKAFDAVHATEDLEADNREVFTGADGHRSFWRGQVHGGIHAPLGEW